MYRIIIISQEEGMKKDIFPTAIPSGILCNVTANTIIRKLQIEAATITPAANPVSARCTDFPSVFFIKNTHAAPSVVPINGINMPKKVFISFAFSFL